MVEGRLGRALGGVRPNLSVVVSSFHLVIWDLDKQDWRWVIKAELGKTVCHSHTLAAMQIIQAPHNERLLHPQLVNLLEDLEDAGMLILPRLSCQFLFPQKGSLQQRSSEYRI